MTPPDTDRELAALWMLADRAQRAHTLLRAGTPAARELAKEALAEALAGVWRGDLESLGVASGDVGPA